LPIKDIIINLLTQQGREQKHNIVINDLDIKGFELLEYKNSYPLYLLRNVENGKIEITTTDAGHDTFDGFQVYYEISD
jgi:hypothetical protein